MTRFQVCRKASRESKCAFGVVFILSISALIVGCSESSEIDPITGMPTMFCRQLSSKMIGANEAIWNLAKFKGSFEKNKEVVLDLGIDLGAISKVSTEPASVWLTSIQNNIADFLTYFSGAGGSSEKLIGIYGQWNQNFSRLKEFCP